MSGSRRVLMVTTCLLLRTLQSAYTFPWGTLAAINYVAQSAALETTSIAQFGRYPQVNNRGDLGRVDAFSQVDVRLQHDVRLFRSHVVNVSIDVWNLFDQKAVSISATRPIATS
jgi:hypothetical protein